MTGLVINGIIGGGIFGVPGELTKLLGRASPIAMVLAAVVMMVIMAAVTEVASQFSSPGGSYLYARTAFGPSFGIQVGWFWLLAMISGAAAGATLFVGYLAGFVPSVEHGWTRTLAISAVIAIPAIANYLGVRSKRREFLQSLHSDETPATWPIDSRRVVPLQRSLQDGSRIRDGTSGMGRMAERPAVAALRLWGYEDSLAPVGEVKEPRQSIPFALVAGFLVCATVYGLLQFVPVWEHPSCPPQRFMKAGVRGGAKARYGAETI